MADRRARGQRHAREAHHRRFAFPAIPPGGRKPLDRHGQIQLATNHSGEIFLGPAVLRQHVRAGGRYAPADRRLPQEPEKVPARKILNFLAWRRVRRPRGFDAARLPVEPKAFTTEGTEATEKPEDVMGNREGKASHHVYLVLPSYLPQPFVFSQVFAFLCAPPW